MGRRETLTQEAADAIYSADCLIGARRLIASFEDAKAEKYTMITAGQIAKTIQDNPQYEKVAVLMSGDVGFYSGAKSLIEELDDCDIKCICGVGSLQYLCAKLLTNWDDAKVISLHGREDNLCAAVMTHSKTFVLTGGNHTIAAICSELCRYGLSDVMVSVGENLSYENERIVTAKASDLTDSHFDNLSVMLVINPSPLKKKYDVPGLPDEAFLRAEVPMTKSEIRSVSISKLRLKQTDIVYDIGAGTGSVSVEAALVCTKGTVFAIEKNKQAIDLIQRNSQKFGTKNMRVIEGLAPEALSDLPIPDISADQVLVEMHYASLNPIDFKIKHGDLKMVLPMKFPLILGNDGSGIVSKIGNNVQHFKVGDEVYLRPDNRSSTKFFLSMKPMKR